MYFEYLGRDIEESFIVFFYSEGWFLLLRCSTVLYCCVVESRDKFRLVIFISEDLHVFMCIFAFI